MADNITIPAILDLHDLKIDPKIFSQIENLSKAFSNKTDIVDTQQLNKAAKSPFFGVLNNMVKDGYVANDMFKTLYGQINEGNKGALTTLGKLRSATRLLGKISLSGDVEKFSRRYSQLYSLFSEKGLGDLFVSELSSGLNKSYAELKSFDAQYKRSQSEQVAATEKRNKEILALEAKRMSSKASASNRAVAGDSKINEQDDSNRIKNLRADITNRLTQQVREEENLHRERSRQSELEKQQIDAVNALEQKHLSILNEQLASRDRINTARSIQSQIEADTTAEKELARNKLVVEKEVDNVLRQQLDLQNKINAAVAEGIALDNEKLLNARRFINADPRRLANDRINPQNGPNLSSFNDDFFRDSKKGIAELVKQKIHLDNTSFSAKRFGELTALAAKRYTAFIAGTFLFQKIFSLFSAGSQQVTELDKSLTKLRQVSNSTKKEMEDLGGVIFAAAKKTGAGANDIAQGLLIFAQAGFDSVSELREVAKTLAKLPLTSSFDDISATANGLVAVFGQFGLGLKDTGSILDRFNYVAKETAIESQDLIEAASKSGSAFVAAGADLNKFIELTTLLRSSTRESAAVVSTFFRITLTKLGGSKQQNFLETLLGPDIRNLSVIDQLGKLATKFATLSARQKSGVLQSLVDVRQAARMGKLLEEINKQAIAKNNGEKTVFDLIGESAGSVDQDVKTASDNLSTSFGRIQASFTELLASLERDASIKKFVKGIADISEEFGSLLKNGKLVLALIASITGIASLPAIDKFAKGLTGAFRSINSRNVGSAISSDINNPDPTLFVPPRVGRFGRARSFLGRNSGAIGIGAGLLGGIAATGAFDIGGDKPSPRQNIFNRILSNAGGGAAFGAIAGSAIPGVGTAIGAAAGGVLGAITGAIRAINENTQALIDSTADKESKQVAKGNFSGFINSLFDNVPTSISGARKFSSGRNEVDFADLPARSTNASERSAAIKDFLQSSEKNSNNFIKVFKALEEKQISKAAKGEIGVGDVQSSTISEFVKLAEVGKGGSITEQALRDVVATFVADEKLPTLSEIEKLIKVRTGANLTPYEENLIDFFENLTFTLDGTTQSLRDFVKNVTESADVTRKLSTVINDFSATILPSLSSNDKTLINQNGGIGNLGTLQNTLAESLKKIVSSPSVASAISTFTKDKAGNTETSASVVTIKSLIDQISDDATKTLATPIFAAIQGLNGPDSDIGDVLKTLGKVGNDADGLAAELTRTKEIESLYADSLRQSADALSAEITARASLATSLLNLKGTIFEISKSILDSAKTIRSRQIDQLSLDSGGSPLPQSRFTPGITRRLGQAKDRSLGINDIPVGLSENQSNGLRAAEALKTANTSAFGSGKLIQEALIAANRQRIGDANDASTAQRTGSIKNSADQFRKSQASQAAFESASAVAAQYLDELGDRVNAAAEASGLLKNVFESLKGSVIAAGQAVRQLTKKDFADILKDLRSFGKATGGGFDSKSLNKGFDALGPGGLDNVLKGLDLLKDFNLGNGLSGGQLTDKINTAFGAPAIAAALSGFTGKTFSEDDVSKQILKSLQDQREAAKLELQLRKQQSEFYATQKQVQMDNLAALNTQVKILGEISAGLKPMEAISRKVDKLFQENLPVIFNPDITPAESPELPRFKEGRSVGRLHTKADVTEVKQSVEVQPMLINVNLTAENLLNMIGPELRYNIEAAISDKLSTVFADDPEKASKIGAVRPRSLRDDDMFGG